jgi:hypothetical protein
MEQTSINHPFANLSRADILSSADLRLWAGSGMAQALLNEVTRGAVGDLVQCKDNLPGSRLTGRKQATKQEQAAADSWALAASMFDGREQALQERPERGGRVSVDVASIEEAIERARAINHLEQRKAWQAEADPAKPFVSPVHLPPESERKIRSTERKRASKLQKLAYAELQAAAKARGPLDNRLARCVTTIALQAAGHGIRAVSIWRPVISDMAKEEALEVALLAVLEGMAKLAHIDLTKPEPWNSSAVERLLPPVGANWAPGTMGNARRHYLYKAAFRAASRSITAGSVGMTGANTHLYIVELSEWGKSVDSDFDTDPAGGVGFILPTEPAASFETLPPVEQAEQFARARKLVWDKLGCKPRNQWPAEVNARRAEQAKVRRFALLAALLRGESATVALERAKLGASWLVNGKLHEFLRSIHPCLKASQFIPAPV